MFLGGTSSAKRLSLDKGTPMAADKTNPATAADDVSDRSLLGRLRHGSEDAATQLYLRYAQRLRALARAKTGADLAPRLDEDDLVQSIFGSFFRGASQGYYDVPAGEELWKLFLVIALNKIRAKGAYHRAAKRDVRATTPGDWQDTDAEPEARQDDGAYAFLHLVVDELLLTLPPPQRRMIELRIEGHDVAEIAEQTGRSKRSVERVLQDFRKKLSDQLAEE
jgi:RNA polymerase sigma-70 factor (ECF subfamily)